MTREELKGKWNQVKGLLKKQWAQFSDDDINRIEGERDIRVGKILEHYGKSKKEERKTDTHSTRH